MTITKAEQGRIAIRTTLFVVPAVAVAILLVIALGETLISWADGWPGGPAAFMVTLGTLSAVSLVLVAVAFLAYAWPDRMPPALRVAGGRRAAFGWGGGLVAILTLVPLAAALPRRPGPSRDAGCDVADDFGCFVREEHGGAVGAGWLTFTAIVVVAAVVLAVLLRQRRS